MTDLFQFVIDLFQFVTICIDQFVTDLWNWFDTLVVGVSLVSLAVENLPGAHIMRLMRYICVAVCCSLLQSVAVCCCLLQSVAVCCRVCTPV